MCNNPYSAMWFSLILFVFLQPIIYLILYIIYLFTQSTLQYTKEYKRIIEINWKFPSDLAIKLVISGYIQKIKTYNNLSNIFPIEINKLIYKYCLPYYNYVDKIQCINMVEYHLITTQIGMNGCGKTTLSKCFINNKYINDCLIGDSYGIYKTIKYNNK